MISATGWGPFAVRAVDEDLRLIATLGGYRAMCITSDHRVLQTPGLARHGVS